MENIYTPKEAAERLKCSVWTVYSLCENRRIRNFKVGNLVRIRESEIEKYIQTQERIRDQV